jgi:penicillin-binding protein 2
MPSAEWKLRNYRQKWYAGETPSVAIGQGALTVTPLQLARAIAGMAVGGTWHQPHLVKAMAKPEKVVNWNLTPEHVKDVIDGMYGVVNEGGTGVRGAIPGIEVCGKTGSAQLASNEFLKGSGQMHARNMKDNAWFEGFAPRSAPEIVVVALFEHGEHGQFAAPIARDVIKAYFDKKARLAALAQQQSAAAQRLSAMSSLGIPAAGTGQAPAPAAAAGIATAPGQPAAGPPVQPAANPSPQPAVPRPPAKDPEPPR